MKLIYINEIGSDYKGQKQYEFIFSNSTELDIDEWFAIPATSTSESKSPDVKYIDLVGLLKNSDIDLELIQNSDYFGIIDAVDGIISLAWEKFDINSDVQRLNFMFGESLDKVTTKLKDRGFHLIKEEIKFKQL
jgi:hypothetical protein